MTTTIPATARPDQQEQRPADVLVVFGITGDLARVMTFRSLYRLEARGLLNCPIVGVAFDDWSLEHLVDHAREAIVATGEQVDEATFVRFADRFQHGYLCRVHRCACRYRFAVDRDVTACYAAFLQYVNRCPYVARFGRSVRRSGGPLPYFNPQFVGHVCGCRIERPHLVF